MFMLCVVFWVFVFICEMLMKVLVSNGGMVKMVSVRIVGWLLNFRLLMVKIVSRVSVGMVCDRFDRMMMNLLLWWWCFIYMLKGSVMR